MIIDGLWGIIGAIIGGLLTFFSQYLFELRHEKKENRKTFLGQHYLISENIFKIKSALRQFKSFANMDLSKCTDDELEELYRSINHFSRECSNIWFGFRDVLLTYFYKLINDKSFLILDDSITNIINTHIGRRYFEFEMFRNIHEHLQKRKNDFQEAIVLFDSIENEYIILRKKLIKNII